MAPRPGLPTPLYGLPSITSSDDLAVVGLLVIALDDGSSGIVRLVGDKAAQEKLSELSAQAATKIQKSTRECVPVKIVEIFQPAHGYY